MLKAVELLVLSGEHIRLEPLGLQHVAGLVAAAEQGGDLYRWSPVPQEVAAAEKYVQTALAWQRAGTAVPFATLRRVDGRVIGSTRFWNIEYWPWPSPHPKHGREPPDALEIGYTWLAPAAIRTVANTEAKYLMLRQAFEAWDVVRVCFHTDVRNARSQTALTRMGARFEGTLRAHRIAADLSERDSARFSILASEWPDVKRRLLQKMEHFGRAQP